MQESSNTPETLQEYDIQVHCLSQIYGEPLEIEGTVTNLSASSWGPEHRIGLRDFKAIGSFPIPGIEFRANSMDRFVPPGATATFFISVPYAALPLGVESCVIDLVHEHVLWMSEVGGKPVEIRFDHCADTRTYWLKHLMAIGGLSASGAAKMSVIRKVIMDFDFRDYSRVRELRRIMAPESDRTPLLRASTATIQEAITDDVGVFAKHFASVHGMASAQMDDPAAVGGMFPGLFKSMRDYFHGICPPFSQQVYNWLNHRALPLNLAQAPITRSLIAALPSDQPLFPRSIDRSQETYWSFVTSVLIDENLPLGLIPDFLRNELTAGAPSRDRDRFPQVSAFMRRLYNDDRNYASRYDISQPAGRCGFAFDLLVLSIDNEVRRSLLGRDVFAWLTSPIDESFQHTPFEVILLANAGLKPQDQSDDLVDDPCKRLQRSLDWLPQTSKSTDNSIRILGMPQSTTGLGANLHMSRRAMTSVGLNAHLVDVEARELISHPSPTPLCRPFDLFHLNLDDVPRLAARYASHARPNTFRACFALWETSAMPAQHKVGAQIVDEIWAPTNYVADIYRRAGHEHVHVVGKGISLDCTPRPPRLAKSDAFTFLLCFDTASWIDRKNPAAAVEAFRDAFSTRRDVRLIVKTNGLYDHLGDRSRQVERISSAAANDDRIVLLNDHMPFDEYLGLIQSADATLSPHRAEGFGYLPAFSLLLGVPVIATDYSGTADFCTEKTSFPVRYKLLELNQGDFVYHTHGACWADIDRDHLIEQMRFVVEHRSEANKRAQAGRKLIQRQYSMDTFAQTYKSRILAACQ